MEPGGGRGGRAERPRGSVPAALPVRLLLLPGRRQIAGKCVCVRAVALIRAVVKRLKKNNNN